MDAPAKKGPARPSPDAIVQISVSPVDDIPAVQISVTPITKARQRLSPRPRELPKQLARKRQQRSTFTQYLRLHLKSADVAHRVAWEPALVGGQRRAFRINAINGRDLVNRDAARTKRVRLCRSTVVL